MSIATVVTRGFGSFGDIAHVARRGYEQAVVVITYRWKIPTSAADGMTRDILVFSNDTLTVVDHSAGVVAASGYYKFNIGSGDTAPTKRFAMLHNWDGDTATQNINSSVAIAEAEQVP
jgi:hypothetical protein